MSEGQTPEASVASSFGVGRVLGEVQSRGGEADQTSRSELFTKLCRCLSGFHDD